MKEESDKKDYITSIYNENETIKSEEFILSIENYHIQRSK